MWFLKTIAIDTTVISCNLFVLISQLNSGLGAVWNRFQLDLDVDWDILDEVTVATTHSPDAEDIRTPLARISRLSRYLWNLDIWV